MTFSPTIENNGNNTVVDDFVITENDVVFCDICYDRIYSTEKYTTTEERELIHHACACSHFRYDCENCGWLLSADYRDGLDEDEKDKCPECGGPLTLLSPEQVKEII